MNNTHEVTIFSKNAPNPMYVNEANPNSHLLQVSSSGGSHQQKSSANSRESIDPTGRGGSIRKSKLILGGPVYQNQNQSTDSWALASGRNGRTHRSHSLQQVEVFTEDDLLTFDCTSDAPSPYSRWAATMSGDPTRIALAILITYEPASSKDGWRQTTQKWKWCHWAQPAGVRRLGAMVATSSRGP